MRSREKTDKRRDPICDTRYKRTRATSEGSIELRQQRIEATSRRHQRHRETKKRRENEKKSLGTDLRNEIVLHGCRCYKNKIFAN